MLQSTAQPTGAQKGNEEASSSSASAASTGKSSGSTTEVSRAVTELGEVIRNQVSSYKKPLLRQALHVLHMDQWLTHIHQNVQTFNDHFLQVRHELREPFQALSEQGKQISKAHKVSHLLRSVHLFMIQLTRLKRVLGNESVPSVPMESLTSLSAPPTPAQTRNSNSSTSPSEDASEAPNSTTSSNSTSSVPASINLSQAASLVYELLHLVETERLSGVDVIDRETPWIIALRNSLKAKSANWLFALSQPDFKPSVPAPSNVQVPAIEVTTITDAVHVLYSLNALGEVLTQVLETRRKTTLRQVTIAFDISSLRPTPAQVSSGSTAPALQTQKANYLWTQLEKLFRETLPSHIDFLLTMHRLLVSLWKRTIQQSSDDRSGAIESAPSLDDPYPFSADSSGSLSSFLRFLRNNGPISEELEALSNSNDPVAVVKHLWLDIVEDEFCDSLLRAIKKTKALEPMLSTEFPRLLRLIHALSEHATTQLERNGVNFGILLRNYKLHAIGSD